MTRPVNLQWQRHTLRQCGIEAQFFIHIIFEFFCETKGSVAKQIHMSAFIGTFILHYCSFTLFDDVQYFF